MSLVKPLVFTAAGLLLYSLFSKGQTLGRLIFYPGKVADIDMLNLSMKMQIICQNTSSDQINLYSFAGELYAKTGGTSTLIGNVSSFRPVGIRGNSQSVITVNVKLFALSVVNEVIRAFQQNNFTQELVLNSYANVDNAQVPIDLDFKVGL